MRRHDVFGAFFIMFSDLCQTTTFYLPYRHHHRGIPQNMCHCRARTKNVQIQFEGKLKRHRMTAEKA